MTLRTFMCAPPEWYNNSWQPRPSTRITQCRKYTFSPVLVNVLFCTQALGTDFASDGSLWACLTLVFFDFEHPIAGHTYEIRAWNIASHINDRFILTKIVVRVSEWAENLEGGMA